MRLMVLLDIKLSQGQRLSQACHAVAQFMLEHPGDWPNETIVLVQAPKFRIMEAISLGATGFTDPYYGSPKACAFLDAPHLIDPLTDLELA